MKCQSAPTPWYQFSKRSLCSTMFLSFDGNGARYAQLARSLKRAILEGQLKAGAALPATRVLAAQLKLSRNTVLTAYEMLCAEQLAVTRGGSGTFVSAAIVPRPAAPPPRRRCRRRRATPSACARLPQPALRGLAPRLRYDLHYGEPLIDPPLASAWRRELARAAGGAHWGYPPAAGLRVLRQAIAEYLARRRGVVCDADDVVVVSGTQQAVSLLARVLLDEGALVAIEDPGYELTSRTLQAHGARLLPVKVDAEGLRVEALPARPAGAPGAGVTVAPVSVGRNDVAGAPHGAAGLCRRARLLGAGGRLRRRVPLRRRRHPGAALAGPARARALRRQLLEGAVPGLAPGLRGLPERAARRPDRRQAQRRPGLQQPGAGGAGGADAQRRLRPPPAPCRGRTAPPPHCAARRAAPALRRAPGGQRFAGRHAPGGLAARLERAPHRGAGHAGRRARPGAASDRPALPRANRRRRACCWAMPRCRPSNCKRRRRCWGNAWTALPSRLRSGAPGSDCPFIR